MWVQRTRTNWIFMLSNQIWRLAVVHAHNILHPEAKRIQHSISSSVVLSVKSAGGP
jgi:hypothetical protein